MGGMAGTTMNTQSEMNNAHTTSCQCAYCDLIRNDVQVCDVLVTKTSKNDYSVRFPTECRYKNDEVALAMSVIAHMMKEKHKLNKRGQSMAQQQEGNFYLNVECVVDRKVWKVCFHVEKSEDPS